jgi:hypothetical protein
MRKEIIFYKLGQKRAYVMEIGFFRWFSHLIPGKRFPVKQVESLAGIDTIPCFVVLLAKTPKGVRA